MRSSPLCAFARPQNAGNCSLLSRIWFACRAFSSILCYSAPSLRLVVVVVSFSAGRFRTRAARDDANALVYAYISNSLQANQVLNYADATFGGGASSANENNHSLPLSCTGAAGVRALIVPATTRTTRPSGDESRPPEQSWPDLLMLSRLGGALSPPSETVRSQQQAGAPPSNLPPAAASLRLSTSRSNKLVRTQTKRKVRGNGLERPRKGGSVACCASRVASAAERLTCRRRREI